MKKITMALLLLASASAFADQYCKTLTPNDDPFGKAWLNTQQGNDSYTFCAEVSDNKLSNLTVQHDFGGTFPVEANKKNAKHFCKILLNSKASAFEESSANDGVSLFATVTSTVSHSRGASYSTIETPVMNPAFASVSCTK